jgi:adenosylmethionine-8-amino-7-oxononanoate aminotransferase
MVIDQERTRVIHRDMHADLPIVERGEGIYLFDEDGNRYIDGSGGSSAVTAIGHGVPEVVDAITEQLSKIACSPTHAFSTRAVEECAQLIVEEFSPEGFGKVWFVSGGSEAVENAIKMAIQYHRDRGNGTRHMIIGRWGSYHGGSFATLAAGGNAARRAKYAPNLMHTEHIPACHAYRSQCNRNGSECDLSCAHQLEYVIKQVGADNVAAFVAEPVVGATLGASPASDGYFQTIREICDRYGVLFIADEVMSGFGRTGMKMGIDRWGVKPDLIATAKGISGGYTPLGAVITSPEIVGEVRQRGASFVIGHTASGNPLSCATGVAVMRYILDNNLIDNARDTGSYFQQSLRQLMERHEIIGDVRGIGLLAGVELVADRATKTPFPVELRVSKKISLETQSRGLISYPLQGSADGVSGDHLLYAPPLIITRGQVDDLVSILDESLTAISPKLMAYVS